MRLSAYDHEEVLLDDVNLRILTELQVSPRLPMAELARRIGMSAPSVTERVQRLERAGFVRRRRDPADGRATLVESTPAGTALRDRVEQLWAELEAATVGTMSEASQSALLRGLLQVESNLASHGPADQ